MGVRGIGLDVVGLDRFAAAAERSPALVERVFTAAEREGSRDSLAGRWAAKEALAKALGAPRDLAWHDVDVVTDAGGQPRLVTRGTVRARMVQLGVDTLHVSITHDGGVAAAVVIAEGDS